MARVLITRRLVGDALDRLGARHDLLVWEGDGPPTPEQLRKRVAHAHGLLCTLEDRIDAELLEAAPDLRAISNYAVGTDNVDLAACAARGISVGRTPDALTDATADLAMGLILAVARRIPEARQAVLDGHWRNWEPAGWLGMELRGAKLLVVGGGRIGTALAERAHGFGMRVRISGRGEPLPFERADVVSLHCPLTPETRHLIDAAALERLPAHSIVVNTARGPIVDTDALARALEQGQIAAAGLDVTDPEPLPADHPLLRLPNALVVPHIGSATTAARARMTQIAVENLMAGLAGEPLPHPATA